MNDMEKELINYNYKNESINKWIKIFNRTKSKRIKNKQFVKILVEAIKERKIIKTSEVVMLDIDVYQELKSYEDIYLKLKEKAEKE